MLKAIQEKLGALVASTWAADTQAQGDLVALFRKYYEGDHRLKLTKEMKAMMQIGDERLDRYNANYCEMVIGAMADRLTVDKIEISSPSPSPLPGEGESNTGQEWLDDLLEGNRFDALQIDVREAALRDGETFVMAQYNDATNRVDLAHEPAWDGDTGVLVVLDRQQKNIEAGIKVWYEGDTRRVNIYYPNSLEKYSVDASGQMLVALSEPEDTARGSEAGGVPLIRFLNKGGKSELVNVIPLQDSLNRTLVSMVMSAELTAFSILWAKGWKPPNALTPGMILHAMVSDASGNPVVPEGEEEARALATMLGSFSLERIEGGGLTELIGQAEFLINQIATITSTPVPGMMGGDTQSGEALKQRDTRLLGKINRGQVQFGNSWEDLIGLAQRQQNLYGATKAPVITRLNTRWKSAEIRNYADILAAAKLIQEWGFEREALKVLSQSGLVNYSEADIDRMMTEKAKDVGRALAEAAGNLPGMDNVIAA